MKPQRPDKVIPYRLGEERRDLDTRSTFGSSEVARVAPGGSWDVRRRGMACFHPPPGPPSSTNGALVRWPIDADAPWKSHGRLRRTARTDPSTAFSTELGKPANGRRFPTSVNRPAALRRGALARSLFPNDGTNTIDRSQALATQSTRPLNRGRSNHCQIELCVRGYHLEESDHPGCRHE